MNGLMLNAQQLQNFFKFGLQALDIAAVKNLLTAPLLRNKARLKQLGELLAAKALLNFQLLVNGADAQFTAGAFGNGSQNT